MDRTQARPMYSFAEATRQNIRQIDSLPFAAGGRASIALPRTDILARIHLHFTGVNTITLGGGTATLSTRGPWNVIRRIRVEANQGTQILDLSGFGALIEDILRRYQYEPDDGQINSAFSGDLFSAGVAAGANVWEFGLTLPIAINERDFAGSLLLQTDTLTTNVTIEWNQPGGVDQSFPVVLTGAATAVLTGSAVLHLETFTVPAVDVGPLPIDTLHQTLEFVQPIAQTGDQTIKLLRANTYVQVAHIVELNGQPNSNDVDRVRLRYNNSIVPYDMTRRAFLQLMRRRYGRDMPTGVFIHDFNDQGYPGFGAGRDFVDGDALAELDSIITIANGATIGSNAFIRTITSQLVQMV